MNKAFLTSIAISALIISLIATTFPYPVRAEATSPIYFPESGLTIISPMNITYSGRVILNVNLNSAGTMGTVDSQISLTYSIDGIYDGSVPLKSNGELHVVTQAVGTVVLPELPDGLHCLSLNLYGLNQKSYEPKYLSFFYTFSFSTVGNPNPSSTINPTQSPTATPSPSPSPSPNPTPSATPNPTITPTPTAIPNDSIYFDSGVIIYSPLNTTYSCQNLVLNLSLCSAGVLGGLDRQISMNYKIDNIQSGSVPLESNGELHVATIAVGTVALPKLPEGSHNLTISLYGLNQRSWFNSMFNKSNEPKYLSYENTVYFAINLSNSSPTSTLTPFPSPIPTSTPSPSPSPTPTPLSSPTQQPTLEPTQSAPPTEPTHSLQPLPYSQIITVTAGIIAITIVGLAAYFAKFGKKKTAN